MLVVLVSHSVRVSVIFKFVCASSCLVSCVSPLTRSVCEILKELAFISACEALVRESLTQLRVYFATCVLLIVSCVFPLFLSLCPIPEDLERTMRMMKIRSPSPGEKRSPSKRKRNHSAEQKWDLCGQQADTESEEEEEQSMHSVGMPPSRPCTRSPCENHPTCSGKHMVVTRSP